MGLAVLPDMEVIIAERKKITEHYNALLNLDKLQTLSLRERTEWNYSYYPVIFESEEKLLEAEQALKNVQVLPRRYFYPSLNTLPYVEHQAMPIAESISKRILCLPLYTGLKAEEIKLISEAINNLL